MCQFIGFDRFGEEYKVMGLSAYGKNRYARVMRKMIGFHPHRGLQLNLRYFVHQNRNTSFEKIHGADVQIPRMWSERLAAELGPARDRAESISERDQDIACAVQQRYEEVFLDMIAALVRKTGLRDITDDSHR